MSLFTALQLSQFTQQLSELRDDFSTSFSEDSDESFEQAKVALASACTLVNELSYDTETFPEGLTSLPTDLRHETDLDYVLCLFDELIDVLTCAQLESEQLESLTKEDITVRVSLIGSEGGVAHFSGTFTYGSNNFSMEPVSDSQAAITDDHTVRTEFECNHPQVKRSGIAINGDAWRDLEAAECEAPFLQIAFFTNADPQDFLDDTAANLTHEQAGLVL